jgi:FkbM family methyltransferase
MLPIVKKIGKKIIALAPIPLTKNEAYDRLTHTIINKTVVQNSIAIDIGCNEGKILQMMVQACKPLLPLAFEPIPVLYNNLQQQFGNTATIYNIALSNTVGEAQFSVVLSNMAFSGLQQRAVTENMEKTSIIVQTNLLDNITNTVNHQIALIKIDVEGAELLVLQGAVATIKKHKPLILFEFGKKGAEAYHYNETDIFQFFAATVHYKIYTLQAWLQQQSALSATDFAQHYHNDSEYFFVAAAI